MAKYCTMCHLDTKLMSISLTEYNMIAGLLIVSVAVFF